MNLGFFLVFRNGDAQHYLHADALVQASRALMPEVPVTHFTDAHSPVVAETITRRLPHGPLLERRLEHYARCEGDWLLVDTDVMLGTDVRAVFDDPTFDVALVDRVWPHLPQDERTLQTMPFNTGVVFSRCPAFWSHTLDLWREAASRDWLSEQRAVWATVRTGQYRVKILPGLVYNYPPQARDDAPPSAAIRHYKGPRKAWLTERIYTMYREAA